MISFTPSLGKATPLALLPFTIGIQNPAGPDWTVVLW